MTDHLTEDEVLTAIPGLTRTRLVAFIESEMVMPLRLERNGRSIRVFRRVDFARIQLLCDLSDDFDLDSATLGVVVNLIDQLHEKRQDLLLLAQAIAAEPTDVRTRIGAAVLKSSR